MTYNEAHDILGVKINADSKEIKEAYKKLAKKYHPDIYKGETKFAEEKMKQINEAYAMLVDLENNYFLDAEYRRTCEEYQRIYEVYCKVQEELQKEINTFNRKLKILSSVMIGLFIIGLIGSTVYGIITLVQFYNESSWVDFETYVLIFVCQLVLSITGITSWSRVYLQTR